MDFLSLPVVMIENIFSYLSYDEIAKNRLVSKAFNEICTRILNRGFLVIERRHGLALKAVKAQLPRRESERRYHPLSRHCDILTSIETRISMLNMTYSKFIDNGLCCFIPGKVIDEIRRVLSIVENSKTPPRAHEVLQELRDISSMAIEHFDDKISPAFRKKLQEQAPAIQTRSISHGALSVNAAGRIELAALQRRAALNARLSLLLAAQHRAFYRRMVEYRKLATKQRRTIKEMAKRQRAQDAAIADLKKRIEECDIKYSELTHTNQASGGKTIAGSSAAPRHFASQIKLDLSVLPIGKARAAMLPNMKPRKPLIRLPSLSEDDAEPPRKVPKLDEIPSTSTAHQSQSQSQIQNPKCKNQTTMTKIKGIANEIRHLTTLTRSLEGKLKRSNSSAGEATDNKKQKLE